MRCMFRCILPPFLTLDKGGVAKRTFTLVVKSVCWDTLPSYRRLKTQLLQSDIHELG